MPAEKLLAEDLAALELGSSLARAEDLQTLAFEEVYDPGDQWSLRAHNGEVDRFIPGKIQEPFDVISCDIHALSFLRDACVTRGAIDLRL